MNRDGRKLLRTLLCLALALLMLPAQVLAAAPADPDEIVYHYLTIDPNGGAFADGTSAPKTFKLRSTGYLSADDLAAAGIDEDSNSGYLPIGYGKTVSGGVTLHLSQLAGTRFTENTTLYVIWGKAINMTLYANGGFLFARTSSGYEQLPDPYVTTVAAGDQMLVSSLMQLAVRDRYEFGGLATDAAGSNPVSTQIVDGEECYTFPDHDVTYYIQWNGPYDLAVTQHPADVTAAVGQLANFSVTATGVGLKYQWQYYVGGKWVDSKMQGYDTPQLSVPVTGERNGRTYRCRIVDRSGDVVVSDSARLTVSTTLIAQPADAELPIGDTAAFTVKITGPKLKYRWQYNKGNGWADSGMTGYNTATLKVPVTAVRNGQQYRCIITDGNGAALTTDAATLLVKTVITKQPDTMLGPIGKTVKFTVKASGVGLTYQWQYYTGSKWANSGMTGNQTAALEVPVTAARNGQLYRCIITDANGNTLTTLERKLKVKTVIITQPRDVNVSVGENAVFTVKASGVDLSYKWQYFDGTQWRTSGQAGWNTDTLSVPATNARNGQQYRCHIIDGNGKVIYSDAAKMIVG